MNAYPQAVIADVTRRALNAARRQAPAWLDTDELHSLALVGIAKALDTYDPTHGAKLTTWATQRAYFEVQHFVRRQDWISSTTRDEMQATGRDPYPVECLPLPLSGFLHADGELRDPVADERPGPETEALRAVGDAAALELLTHLHPREQAVLYWRFWDELPFSVIGPRLGVHPNHAGKMCRQALAKLRTMLETSE